MKKSDYKSVMLLATVLFLITFTLTGQEVSREFHREFVSAPGTTIDLNNRYGDITIQSWNQNQIVIDVKVSILMPDKQKAEKLMNYIDVQFNEADKIVSAKTVFDEKFNFSGWITGSRKFSVDYNVKMPVGANLKLVNRYGDTDIDELHGLVDIDIKYGNLNAGKLTRGNEKPFNNMTISYGKGSIDEAGWLDILVRYCPEIKISKSQALLLDSKYSKIQIGKTSSLVGESKYDNLRIEAINNLIIENGYAEVNIGSLTKKLDYKGSYGSLSAERIPSGFDSLKVNTRYTGVRLGIEETASYYLDAKVTYGGLKFNENKFRSQRQIADHNSKEISGIIGNDEDPKSKVNIESSYGSVKLY
jgi:hypothetical protein